MPENLASEMEFMTNGTWLQWLVVNGESVNKLKGYLDHHLRNNMGSKYEIEF